MLQGVSRVHRIVWMMPNGEMLLAQTGYAPVLVTVIVAMTLAALILVATHVIGPSRHGPVKDSTYESGVAPIGDARRRFNVRYYVIAMLFLLFDVEIVFIYPWAILFPRLQAGPESEHAAWAQQMVQAGFGPIFFFTEMLIFTAILVVGYIYAWRKGVFRWD